MVKTKLRETTTSLEQKLAEEQATRLRAEELAHLTQMMKFVSSENI
ncbi:hypothetical protein RGQ29_022864 [Quercus rubra]|uniref:Uncharacterized protein n=1 Tax=Quercus rubra TaxID=3512 RepID=A0AAN7IT66_QUERU|nr:hypothetical protein RGQ29_022864 [Quercus rubra]